MWDGLLQVLWATFRTQHILFKPQIKFSFLLKLTPFEAVPITSFQQHPRLKVVLTITLLEVKILPLGEQLRWLFPLALHLFHPYHLSIRRQGFQLFSRF